VALVEDRCPACGRDPELELLALGAPAHRPPSGPARPRSVNWRRWAPVAAVSMALWTFLAFAGGDDDEGIPIEDAAGETTTTEAEAEHEDRTTTTRRRRPPTTTTTQVIPDAPLLGEPTGLSLVVVTSAGRVIDVDSGAVTRVGVPIRGVTAAGLLVEEEFGLATWPPPYDGSGSTTIIPPGRASSVELVWVVDGGRHLWTIEWSVDGRLPGPGPRASLLDLGGEVLGSFELPGEVGPGGATDHGLVVYGPGGVYLVDASGRADRVSTGDLLDAGNGHIHVHTCDEALRCGVEVFDGRGRHLGSGPSPVNPFGFGASAPDGRVAQVSYTEDGFAVGVDGVTVYEDEGFGFSGQGSLAWSPDGRWLAIAASEDIRVVDTLGDSGVHVVDHGLVEQVNAVYFVAPAG
jgi:hypothetical protein